MLMVLFFVALGMFVVFNDKEVVASDAHLVVISHDKKQETLPTRAKTVGELLDRVNITLNEGDVVEPSEDTEILDEKFRINVYRARPVVVVDGDKKTFAFSAATTPRSVASQAGIQVYPEDNLESKMETDFIKDSAIGEKVIIDRATPANLNLYGTPVPVRTHAKTVGDLLKEKQVELASDDTVQPAVETPITDQVQIFVIRNGTKVVSAEEPIAMEIEVVEDSSLSFGASAIRQKGAPGKRVVTYQLELQNDKEVGRKVIQSVVAQEPVKQIVARGKAFDISQDKAALLAAAGVKQSDFPYVDYILTRESGWCATKAQGQYGACRPLSGPVPTSGGYGLCQSTPPQKMATAGADWQTNPVTQLKWCHSYAMARYGSWAAAYNKWIVSHNW